MNTNAAYTWLVLITLCAGLMLQAGCSEEDSACMFDRECPDGKMCEGGQCIEPPDGDAASDSIADSDAPDPAPDADIPADPFAEDAIADMPAEDLVGDMPGDEGPDPGFSFGPSASGHYVEINGKGVLLVGDGGTLHDAAFDVAGGSGSESFTKPDGGDWALHIIDPDA